MIFNDLNSEKLILIYSLWTNIYYWDGAKTKENYEKTPKIKRNHTANCGNYWKSVENSFWNVLKQNVLGRDVLDFRVLSCVYIRKDEESRIFSKAHFWLLPLDTALVFRDFGATLFDNRAPFISAMNDGTKVKKWSG